jgi:hypothetical protein
LYGVTATVVGTLLFLCLCVWFYKSKCWKREEENIVAVTTGNIIREENGNPMSLDEGNVSALSQQSIFAEETGLTMVKTREAASLQQVIEATRNEEKDSTGDDKYMHSTRIKSLRIQDTPGQLFGL